MSSSQSFSRNHYTANKPAYGKHRHEPYHSSENTPNCPYVNTPTGCTNPQCRFVHPKDYVRMCPFMNTPTGCTNLHCPHPHPEGFIHACIFGANCKKRATGECQLLHPDERGFAVPQAYEHHNKRPRCEASPPPLPPRETPIAVKQQTSEIAWNCSRPFELSITATEEVAEMSEDDKFYVVEEENGSKYCIDSEGNIVGAYNSDGVFTSFCPILVDSSKPDYKELTDKKNDEDAYQDELNQMIEEMCLNSDDEDETDPDAYN